MDIFGRTFFITNRIKCSKIISHVCYAYSWGCGSRYVIWIHMVDQRCWIIGHLGWLVYCGNYCGNSRHLLKFWALAILKFMTAKHMPIVINIKLCVLYQAWHMTGNDPVYLISTVYAYLTYFRTATTAATATIIIYIIYISSQSKVGSPTCAIFKQHMRLHAYMHAC